jgi:hypothetical protein
VKELKATAVVAVPIEMASAKVRCGPPGDEEEDYALPVWAGVLPLSQVVGLPEADQRLVEDCPFPEYIVEFVAARNG